MEKENLVKIEVVKNCADVSISGVSKKKDPILKSEQITLNFSVKNAPKP